MFNSKVCLKLNKRVYLAFYANTVDEFWPGLIAHCQNFAVLPIFLVSPSMDLKKVWGIGNLTVFIQFRELCHVKQRLLKMMYGNCLRV